MSAAAIIAVISAAAPLVQELVQAGKDWLDLYEKDPTNPELVVLWNKMNVQRKAAKDAYKAAVDQWYADHPDVERHDA